VVERVLTEVKLAGHVDALLATMKAIAKRNGAP
jgi:hypothetical protein